ncbi:deubiquitinating enzyme, partial [Coemansia sp. RSA 2320]
LEDKAALERKLAKQAKRQESDGAAAAPAEAEVEPAAAAEPSIAAGPFVLDDSFKADVGCNPSGVYELVGIVTHIGRSANSGHYMGWVRKEKGVGGPEPKGAGTPETRNWWYKFDDDEVSMVTDDDILKLCGGGDWHTAYITLYRAKKID